LIAAAEFTEFLESEKCSKRKEIHHQIEPSLQGRAKALRPVTFEYDNSFPFENNSLNPNSLNRLHCLATVTITH